MKARHQLILSLLFFFSSLAVWNLVMPVEKPQEPTPAVCPFAEASSQHVTGVWEQYALHNGHRSFMARLDIRHNGVDYTAHPMELSANTFPKHSYRSFDHKFSNGVWTFKEDWDYGEVGEFTLVEQPNGDYAGVATSSDGYQFETVFVRVK